MAADSKGKSVRNGHQSIDKGALKKGLTTPRRHMKIYSSLLPQRRSSHSNNYSSTSPSFRSILHSGISSFRINKPGRISNPSSIERLGSESSNYKSLSDDTVKAKDWLNTLIKRGKGILSQLEEEEVQLEKKLIQDNREDEIQKALVQQVLNDDSHKMLMNGSMLCNIIDKETDQDSKPYRLKGNEISSISNASILREASEHDKVDESANQENETDDSLIILSDSDEYGPETLKTQPQHTEMESQENEESLFGNSTSNEGEANEAWDAGNSFEEQESGYSDYERDESNTAYPARNNEVDENGSDAIQSSSKEQDIEYSENKMITSWEDKATETSPSTMAAKVRFLEDENNINEGEQSEEIEYSSNGEMESVHSYSSSEVSEEKSIDSVTDENDIKEEAPDYDIHYDIKPNTNRSYEVVTERYGKENSESSEEEEIDISLSEDENNESDEYDNGNIDFSKYMKRRPSITPNNEEVSHNETFEEQQYATAQDDQFSAMSAPDEYKIPPTFLEHFGSIEENTSQKYSIDATEDIMPQPEDESMEESQSESESIDHSVNPDFQSTQQIQEVYEIDSSSDNGNDEEVQDSRNVGSEQNEENEESIDNKGNSSISANLENNIGKTVPTKMFPEQVAESEENELVKEKHKEEQSEEEPIEENESEKNRDNIDYEDIANKALENINLQYYSNNTNDDNERIQNECKDDALVESSVTNSSVDASQSEDVDVNMLNDEDQSELGVARETAIPDSTQDESIPISNESASISQKEESHESFIHEKSVYFSVNEDAEGSEVSEVNITHISEEKPIQGYEVEISNSVYSTTSYEDNAEVQTTPTAYVSPFGSDPFSTESNNGNLQEFLTNTIAAISTSMNSSAGIKHNINVNAEYYGHENFDHASNSIIEKNEEQDMESENSNNDEAYVTVNNDISKVPSDGDQDAEHSEHENAKSSQYRTVDNGLRHEIEQTGNNSGLSNILDDSHVDTDSRYLTVNEGLDEDIIQEKYSSPILNKIESEMNDDQSQYVSTNNILRNVHNESYEEIKSISDISHHNQISVDNDNQDTNLRKPTKEKSFEQANSSFNDDESQFITAGNFPTNIDSEENHNIESLKDIVSSSDNNGKPNMKRIGNTQNVDEIIASRPDNDSQPNIKIEKNINMRADLSLIRKESDQDEEKRIDDLSQNGSKLEDEESITALQRRNGEENGPEELTEKSSEEPRSTSMAQKIFGFPFKAINSITSGIKNITGSANTFVERLDAMDESDSEYFDVHENHQTLLDDHYSMDEKEKEVEAKDIKDNTEAQNNLESVNSNGIVIINNNDINDNQQQSENSEIEQLSDEPDVKTFVSVVNKTAKNNEIALDDVMKLKSLANQIENRMDVPTLKAEISKSDANLDTGIIQPVQNDEKPELNMDIVNTVLEPNEITGLIAGSTTVMKEDKNTDIVNARIGHEHGINTNTDSQSQFHPHSEPPSENEGDSSISVPVEIGDDTHTANDVVVNNGGDVEISNIPIQSQSEISVKVNDNDHSRRSMGFEELPSNIYDEESNILGLNASLPEAQIHTSHERTDHDETSDFVLGQRVQNVEDDYKMVGNSTETDEAIPVDVVVESDDHQHNNLSVNHESEEAVEINITNDESSAMNDESNLTAEGSNIVNDESSVVHDNEADTSVEIDASKKKNNNKKTKKKKNNRVQKKRKVPITEGSNRNSRLGTFKRHKRNLPGKRSSHKKKSQ